MRVLAIDGGGIRGLIPALVLAEIERRADRPVSQLFDLIAGTSTGGIIACAVCAPDPMPAEEVAALHEDDGPEIFDRSVWQRVRSAEGLLDEKYDATALDQVLERFLGGKRLAESRPDLIVPTYDMSEPGPYFFKTSKARKAAHGGLPADRGGPVNLRRPDLLRAPAGRRARAGGRRRVRGQPGDERLRGDAARTPRRGRLAALARHGPHHAQAPLRGRGRLGPRRVGPPRSSTSSSTAARSRRLPAAPSAWRGPLLAPTGRADESERRPRRREPGQPARAA